MKTKLLTICLLLFASKVFAADFVDTYKSAINKCSSGINKIFNYDNGNGYIFFGESLDKFCLCKDFKNCSKKTLYEGYKSFGIEDKFIERGKYFWFVAHKKSHISVIQDVNFGVVISDIMSTTAHLHDDGTENTYIINDLFSANKQDDINIKVFDRVNRGIEFHKKHYIQRYQKDYITSSGGAMWFHTKRNYQHEILELLDIDSGTKVGVICESPDEIIKNFDSNLDKTNKYIAEATKNGRSKWWLAALKYHRKPTWCYSQ